MYPREFIDYLVHFHGDRDYFECHEILEEYWKNREPHQKNSIYVGWILLAVSAYHHRRGNTSGARKTLIKAVQNFREHREELRLFGFDPEEFLEFVEDKLAKLSERYIDDNLPIKDKRLLALCQQACQKQGFVWGQTGSENKFELVHRHQTRDRTEVVQARKKALLKRKGREP